MGSRSQALLAFPEYTFHKVLSYKLKLCKHRPRELNGVSGDWSVRLEGFADLLNLTDKEFIKLTREVK